MVFKYFMPTLPSTDLAWAAGGSWCSWRAGFPSRVPTAQESCITVEVHTSQLGQPRRGVRGSVTDGLHLAGALGGGSSSSHHVWSPGSSFAVHQLAAVPEVRLHSWAVHAGISSCPHCPAPRGTLVLGCEGSCSSSRSVGESHAASPLRADR